MYVIWVCVCDMVVVCVCACKSVPVGYFVCACVGLCVYTSVLCVHAHV